MALATTTEPLTRVHDVALLDLDGVVYIGPEAVPGAREALTGATNAGMRLAYLTNNASRVPGDMAGQLRDLGMPVAHDDEVVTSAQAVSRLIADAVAPDSLVLVAGGDGLRHSLHEAGLRTTDRFDESVSAVVQGFGPDLTWADLAEASYAVHAGVPWFASNTDLTFPTARGVAPGNGSMVQAVANATRTRPVVAGKPERALFEECLARLLPSAPLMVGDRLDTDIEGAARVGIPSLAVLTGVSSLQDLAEAPLAARPDYVGADLSALLLPHPPFTVQGSTARCGEASVHLAQGALRVGQAGEPLHLLRAVLGLAWAVADDTGTPPRVPEHVGVG
ncbi:HAD-IIA family hydrolase [Aeromicrobium sp. CTD01-1L150]|uniref:HAD-IIA family hydrolase n=1 Tax=Aeromicrobium sp. CTD01-1L150 TaxID=3341830 RepID=UPI0035C136E2